ncbi:MAG: transposase domain-containing protein [Bacteroidota bacterium]
MTLTATLRRRRLPVEQVLWLVLDMALFRDRSITEFDLALPGPAG